MTAQEIKDRIGWSNDPDLVQAIMDLCDIVIKQQREIKKLKEKISEHEELLWPSEDHSTRALSGALQEQSAVGIPDRCGCLLSSREPRRVDDGQAKDDRGIT